MPINIESILWARLIAQGLDQPLKEDRGYPELFRRLQPVSPVANTYPGNPPALVKRTVFDSLEASDDLRGDRLIVKARFLGGTVGYVTREDLADYAVVFRKRPTRLNAVEREVLAAVQELGPVTPRLIKEETRLLAKKVGPALARLQRAFLVFEDQTETNWERGWSTFSMACPEIDLDTMDREAAAARILGRFFDAQYFATYQQVRDWSGLPTRDLTQWLGAMVDSGQISEATVEGMGIGWVSAGGGFTGAVPAKSVHMLHIQDGLVRSCRTELKERFGDREVLQYLLIDGQFTGAVCGHWRIGPHDVDDIVLTLPQKEKDSRRDEILKEVASTYAGERHRIIFYDGKKV